MSQTKHTQGPWTVEADENNEFFQIVSKDFNHLITTVDNGSNVINIEANAHLIAAAPELLAALERWQNEWVVNGTPEQHANNHSIEIQINDAINKAKGI